MTRAILLAIFAGTPLLIAPGILWEYDTAPKVVFLLAGAGLLLFTRSWHPGLMSLRESREGRWLLLLLIASAVSLALSAIVSNDWILSLGGSTWRRLGVIPQVAVLVITTVAASEARRHPTFVRPIIVAIELAGGLVGLYGIAQYFGWDPLLPIEVYRNRLTSDLVRPPGTLGHAMYFADFLVPVALFGLTFTFQDMRRNWRMFHAVIAGIAMLGILLSGTRSAFLGLAAGGALLWWIHRRTSSGPARYLRLATGSVAVLLLLAGFLITPAGSGLRARLGQWRDDSKGGPRLMVWRDSVPMLIRHPFLGAGPEMFAAEFRKQESLELARAYPDTYHESPHNLFLEFATAQGLVGLAVMAGLLWLGAHSGARGLRAGIAESLALLAGLVGLVISMQFSPLPLTNLLELYLFVGLLTAISSPRVVRDARSRMFIPHAGAVAGGLILVALACLYAVQEFAYSSIERGFAAHDFDHARSAYSLAKRFPFRGQQLWCSRQMAALSRQLVPPSSEQAIRIAEEASTAAEASGEEGFVALYQSGVLALVNGRPGQAERKLREAIQAAPFWYRPHLFLARLLTIQGRKSEAEQERKIALDCAGSRAAEAGRAL